MKIVGIVKGFSDYIKEAYEDFQYLLKDFEENSKLQAENIAKHEEEISKMKKELMRDKDSLEREKTFINSKKDQMIKDRLKLDDERATISRTISRLKEKRI